MAGVLPKKSLGQHFLNDKNTARRIVQSLTGVGYSQIIEVGPGTGVLSEHLLENSAFKTDFIEIDNEAVTYLKNHFPEIEKNLIQADILKYSLDKYYQTPIAIIGNFPYNISSQIFFKILENRNLVEEVVCMIQKEVAVRITSLPGSKIYGILSVLIQAFYKTEYLFSVGPGQFTPPPKVDSAVVRFIRKDEKFLNCNEKLFFKVVKTAFNQRRKMLRNSLRVLAGNLNPDDPLQELYTKRPEQLSVADFIVLTNHIESLQNQNV